MILPLPNRVGHRLTAGHEPEEHDLVRLLGRKCPFVLDLRVWLEREGEDTYPSSFPGKDGILRLHLELDVDGRALVAALPQQILRSLDAPSLEEVHPHPPEICHFPKKRRAYSWYRLSPLSPRTFCGDQSGK